MCNTSKEYGPLDEQVHLADGSHRTCPPALWLGGDEAWQGLHDRHVAEHVKEAQEANAELQGLPEMLIRDLADQVAQKEQGMTFFLQRTILQGQPYYEFRGLGGRMNREEAIRALLRVLRQPRGL